MTAQNHSELVFQPPPEMMQLAPNHVHNLFQIDAGMNQPMISYTQLLQVLKIFMYMLRL